MEIYRKEQQEFLDNQTLNLGDSVMEEEIKE